MLALYAGEVPRRRLRVAAAVIFAIVVGVVVMSVVGEGMSVDGIAAVEP